MPQPAVGNSLNRSHIVGEQRPDPGVDNMQHSPRSHCIFRGPTQGKLGWVRAVISDCYFDAHRTSSEIWEPTRRDLTSGLLLGSCTYTIAAAPTDLTSLGPGIFP